MQKIPLRPSRFYCEYCGRKLSLLNYAVLRGAFYCQAHYKQLANGGSQEEKTNIKQKCQQWPEAVLPSPGSEPTTLNNPTGKMLMREKMQPRLCSLHPEDGLRSAKQTRPLASRNQLRIRWPPSKEAAAPEDASGKLSKFGTSMKLPRDGALFQHSRPSGFAHEAPGHKSIADNAHTEKKQRLLPKVAFPKRRDCVSCWFKPEGGSEDLDVLAKRASSMDRKIPGSQARKSQAGVSEKDKMCQLANVLQWKGSISTVSPLTSISAKPSVVGSSPFCLKTLQLAKATQSTQKVVLLPHSSSPAKVSFEGYGLRGRSSSKEASKEGNEKETLQNMEALFKARIKLPVLTKLDNRQNRKIPKASEMNTSITIALEESKQFGHVGPKLKPEMEDRELFQTKSETSVYPTEHKDEGSNETKDHVNWISASYPDSLAMPAAPNQIHKDFQEGRNKSPGNIAESTRSASLQGPEKLTCPETLSEEDEKENEMNPEGKPERFGTLDYTPDQAPQDAKLEAIPSVIEGVAEVEDGHSVFRSRADDSENRNFLPSSDPQDATPLCHLTPSANESLEPVMVPNKNEDLPEQAGSENAFHPPSQRDTVEDTVVQASEGKTETFSSRKVANETENQPPGNVNVKSQNQDGSIPQANEGKDIPGDSAKKPPLKTERNPFARVFASKNHVGSPKKEPTGTKNVSKKQSALVTLFGYSSRKDKNKKEQPRKAITKPLMVEGRDEKWLRVESFSSPPNTEENSQVVIQSKNSEANLLDLGGNYQSCSREEQREISPPVVNTKVCSTETLPVVLDTDSSSSAAALSETTNLDIPKPSVLNKETIPQCDAESSPFISFQNPFVTTENMLQSCASSSVETHLITNIASSRDLHNEELSNPANWDSRDLKLEARNVSFSCASREDDVHIMDGDRKIPDMLLFSMKSNRSANTQERAPRFTPDLDLGGSQMKDQPGHALSSSDESLLQRNNSRQLPECGPPAGTESVNDQNILGTGHAGIVQHSDQQTCFLVSADDPFGLGPHDNQATSDSYPSCRDDLPLLLPSLQCMPELLRDTIQGQAGERVAAAERYREEHLAAEESQESPGSIKLAPDRSPSPTVI